MICSKCNAIIQDDSTFCHICGANTILCNKGTTSADPFVALGDLDNLAPEHGTSIKTDNFNNADTTCRAHKSDPFTALDDLDNADNRYGNHIRNDDVIGHSCYGDATRVYYVGDDGLWRDKVVHDLPEKSHKGNTLFCTECGKPVPENSVFCEHCGKRLNPVKSHKSFRRENIKPKGFPWKKLAIAAACVAVLVTGILLLPKNSGLTDSAQPYQVSRPDGYDERYSITKEYISSAEDGIYKMREYGGDTWFCRVSVPNWNYSVSEEVSSGDFWHPYYLYMLDTENYTDFTFQSVAKGKDQLALVGTTIVKCAPIIEMDYTIPYYLGVYSGSIHYRRGIGFISGHNEEFEEINGQDPSTYINRVSDLYNVFRSNRGESFTFSYFSGTDYVEDTVIADCFYYIIEDYNNYISLPVTKTTEGYFVADYSELSPGYYWFSVGDGDTIIEIKG